MSQALKDLKVLDLSMNLPGPYMTWLLAMLGADVVKVENPQGGDYARALPGGGSGKNSAYFEALNRNKKSLTLNLKHPDGRGLFLDLLDTYDVLVEGFRPGTMERFDLGFETTSARQPRLIHVSISGYGQDGPNRSRAGHDVNYLSLAGIIDITGPRDGQPAVPGVQIADVAGGTLMALAGLLAAVIQRERTGRGQFVDVSMFDGSLALATMAFTGIETGMEKPKAGEMLLTGRVPCYGLYRTKEGRYMSLGALEYKFWENFCSAVERPDLLGSQFGGPEVVDEVAEIFGSRTQEEWGEKMKDHDACCEPVLRLDETANSELTRARKMVTHGADGRRYLGCPLRLTDSTLPEEVPAPDLGQHTEEVLSQLGLTTQQIEALAREGVTR
ncbi:MAG: CaiB/BaiF CoA-transferase family protein [Deltaproteobacteria bacterium]